MGVFVAEVRPRWSDMDAFGHVNHARTVTLLEEARIELLFVEAARHGAEAELAKGVVVTRLLVDYHAPLVADGRSIRVEMSVQELRNVSFTIAYTVHTGLSTDDTVAVTAETTLVPYNVGTGRPRRLSEVERDFLAAWRGAGSVRV